MRRPPGRPAGSTRPDPPPDAPPAAAPPPERRADLRLLVPALVAWAVLAATLALRPSVLVALAGAALVASLAAVRPTRLWPRLPVLALTAAATALALTCLAAQSALREAGPVSDLAADRATVTVEGVLGAEPRRVAARAGARADSPLVVVRLLVDTVAGRGSRSAVGTPVLVLGDEAWASLRWMERVRVSGRLRAAPAGDDVVALLDPATAPTRLAPPPLVGRVADQVRERFREATAGLPPDARGLLPGLVIGDTSALPPDLEDAMLDTGMTHLSAVSGSNVAVILAAGLGLCRLAGVRRRWRPLVALGILAAFVVLARPEPSVVRAATMGGVGLLGLSTSRRRAGIPALAAAVLALLCWDPWLARGYGFALSSLATLGLLLFAGSWGEVVGRVLPLRIRSWGPALAVPAAAQLMCAPVVVLLQGSVTLVAVLANLLAAPLVAPATVAGVVTALLSVVGPAAAGVPAWVAAVPTLGIAWVARTVARFPMGTLPWPDGAPGAVLLAGLGVLGVVMGPWLAHRARRRPLVVAGVAVLGLSVSAPTTSLTWPLAHWQLVVCDVGQGDALVLSTGAGRAVLVDTGPDPDAVDGCLARLGVRVLDAIVLTHYHADHVGGLRGAFRGRTVRQVLGTPVREPGYQWEQVRGWLDESQVPLGDLYAGDELAFPGLTAHVWWPRRLVRGGSVPNNASVVLTAHVSGLRVVLLGDVEREAAGEVLLGMRRDEGSAGAGFDVLKVAHHGSANRDDRLLATVAATVAVISVGSGNDYGHPAPATLEALQRAGSRVYRTDRDGDLAFSKAGDGAVLVAARGP